MGKSDTAVQELQGEGNVQVSKKKSSVVKYKERECNGALRTEKGTVIEAREAKKRAKANRISQPEKEENRENGWGRPKIDGAGHISSHRDLRRWEGEKGGNRPRSNTGGRSRKDRAPPAGTG